MKGVQPAIIKILKINGQLRISDDYAIIDYSRGRITGRVAIDEEEIKGLNTSHPISPLTKCQKILYYF